MLAQLTGPQMRELHEALLDAFPSEADLRYLVRFELGMNLFSIVTSSGLRSIAFDLIEWAQAHDKLDSLIQGAQNTNPDNPRLKAFTEQWVAKVRPVPPPPPAPVPPSIAPATHVAIPLSGTPMASLAPVAAQPLSAAAQSFPKWRALLNDLESTQCTPILGPGLLEPLLGSPREMARRWAQSYHFPLAPHAQDDLPQVAQFLATIEKANTLRTEFRKYLCAELLQRYGSLIPAEGRNAAPDDLLRFVAAARWAGDQTDPYQVLAALPFPIYITANPDNLLAEALRAAGRAPQVELCRWLDDKRWPPSIYDTEPDYEPSVARPLVYHLFGRLTLPFSLVLKEDDYFDYLVGFTRYSHLVPSAVGAALADSGLLFLGFRMDDWSFRVLFRSIISQSEPGRRNDYTHVAVQLDPEAATAVDPAGARRYLQSYFESADVSIYWGRVEQFLQDLQGYWVRHQAGQDVP